MNASWHDRDDAKDRAAYDRGWEAARDVHGRSPDERTAAYREGVDREHAHRRGSWEAGWADYVENNAPAVHAHTISPRAWLTLLRAAGRQSRDEQRMIDLVAAFDDLVGDGVIVQHGSAYVLPIELG